MAIEGLAPEFRFINTNGIRLHCAVQGEANSQRGTIVLLHGFPEFWYGWRFQIADLARDYRVVAPDLRGYNLSDKPEGVDVYRVKTLAADVAGLLQSFGAGPITLIGHDWGAAVAWAVAALYPHLLQRLVILNGPHFSTYTREVIYSPEQRKAAQYIHLFRQPRAAKLLAEDGYRRLLRMTGAIGEDALKYVAAWSQPGALDAALNYYRAMPSPPPLMDEEVLDPKIPELKVNVPTLVIWGERDEFILTGNLIGLEHYVPGVKIHRIAEATHWVQHEVPQEVNAAIRGFLTGS